jgi:hypothetical protein
MVMPRTSSARLTDGLKPSSEVWRLRYSVLREIPMPRVPPSDFKRLKYYV